MLNKVLTIISANILRYTFFTRKLAGLAEAVIVKLFTPKQIRAIANRLTTEQRYIIESFLSLGQKLPQYRVEGLRRRLYNLGFTDRARADLHKLAEGNSKLYLIKLAAWELVLWYANQYSEEGARQCLDLLPKALQREKDLTQLRQAAIIEAECHEVMGNTDDAKLVISQALKLGPHADLFLAAANLESAMQEKIKWINKALDLYGISKISFDESVERSYYDCLTTLNSTQKNIGGPNDAPKVSVIIPSYNAGDVIQTALDSVRAQTWALLEIIVVDDCSIDSTAGIIEEYAKKDSRIKLIKAESNGGPYVARNLALKISTGEFVTCHDADDWSHPEKIERQVRHLLSHSSIIGNTSQQARATDDLKFYRRGKPGFYIFSNLSSFMFRRKPVMDAIGYWDSVRFVGDGEFVRRIKKVFGNDVVVDLPTGPLSFQRQTSKSLTGDKDFGYQGYLMGARKEYFDSYNYFHTIADSLYYDFPQTIRPFAVPEPMLPKREVKNSERRHFDVILASDFRLVGGSNMSNVEEIKAQKRMGLRTGLIQISRYDFDPGRNVIPRVRELLYGNQVQMLVFGEKVSCDLLVLRYPPILQEWQRFIADVEAKKIIIIVNQPPMSDYGPDAVLRYNINRCQEHLKRYFGKTGTWYPIGPAVRETLYKHHAEELKMMDLSSEDWVNIIDMDEWRRESRPPKGQKPRIGRHSRDHDLKWPADPDELLAIYPDSTEYEVHILGGAVAPKKTLRRLPKNWHVIEFGEVHPREFLSTLDVFVYYTHPDWVESFGRVIIEAMAVGVPVIIPPHYRKLFGDAAIYAEPSEVKMNVERLMGDDNYYNSRVEKAWNFVEKHFGYSKHAARLEQFFDRQCSVQKYER